MDRIPISDTIYQFIHDQLQSNNFLSGGAVLMVLGGLLAYVRAWPSHIYAWLNRRLFIDLEVTINDDAYDWLNEWLAQHSYTAKWARNLSIRSVSQAGDYDYITDPFAEQFVFATTDQRVLLVPGVGTHWLFWRGRLVIVYRSRHETVSDNAEGRRVQHEAFHLSILTRSKQLVYDLLAEVRQSSENKVSSKIRVYTPKIYHDGWKAMRVVVPRPLESVVLRAGVMELLLQRVRDFRDNKVWYAKMGIPHRYGCGLYGPPGNGKSSAIMVIASELGLNIAVLNLSSPGLTDEKLTDLIHALPENCVLLFEDIDCAMEKENKKNSISLSGLLNAIDGVAAGEGRVLFVTSNHWDTLPPALVRAGRCDDRVFLANADQDQAGRMFLRFFPESPLAKVFAAKVAPDKHSMADIQDYLRVRLSSADKAADEVELMNVTR